MSTFENSESHRKAILSDSNTVRKNVSPAGCATNERWPMSPRKLKGIVDRLYRIVRTKTASIPVKDGVFDSTNEADKTAIAAARVLVSIEAQNQADEHLQVKLKIASGSASSVNVSSTAIAVHDARQFITSDPDYIEYLRDRAAREDGYHFVADLALPPVVMEAGSIPSGDKPDAHGLGERDQQLTDSDAPLATPEASSLPSGVVSRDAPARLIRLEDV